MKITRFLAILLTLFLMIGCVACGNNEQPAADPVPSDVSTTESTTTSTEATGATESTTASTEASSTAPTTQAPTTAAPTTEAPTTTTTAAPTTTTTAATTTTTSGKNIVTFTTTTEYTTTTKDKSQGKAIRILAIGNSFSVDAMNNHLFQIFESAGYTDITLGNLYIGGCALDTHYNNLTNNTAAYTFYLNTDGVWEQRASTNTGTGFAAAQWDVVTIQQVSSDSGRPHTYANLKKALEIIKQKEPRAKIFWHMTWAYQQDSDHWAFQYYDKDQTTMYNAITAAVQEQVLPLTDIDGVIPSGTAIQNLRTSELGDTLTSDGHHLEDAYGDYTAALTWFCTITGEKPEATDYRPVRSYWSAISQAVENALKTPFAVTKCE